MLSWNFEAHLRDESGIVPGSIRRGHNVHTIFGRMWLSRLVALRTLRSIGESGDDVPSDHRRIRWIEVGRGRQLETTNVEYLRSPLVISGGNYLREVTATPAYPDPMRPTRRSVIFDVSYSQSELAGSPYISEAGLIADLNDVSGVYGYPFTPLDPTVEFPEIVAYRSIDPPLHKVTGVHWLGIRWELRF